MTFEEREEFVKVARDGLNEYGACTSYFQDEDGNCCAVGAYTKKKFGDANEPADGLDCDYRLGVIHGFDGLPNYPELSSDKIKYNSGFQDGKLLREEFVNV